MESTSPSLVKAIGMEEKNLAKVKNSRGISARACSAKAMMWKLESAKVPPIHEANISEATTP